MAAWIIKRWPSWNDHQGLMIAEIQLRRATLDDLPEILALFVKAIRQTASNDYEPAQIKAWAAGARNQQRWVDAVNNQYFLVATVEDAIVGFGSLVANNYVDFMFVHPDHHRRGVAQRIYQALEKEAQLKSSPIVAANVSITARPFFLAQGFVVVKENKNQIKGVEITNYRMEKSL